MGRTFVGDFGGSLHAEGLFFGVDCARSVSGEVCFLLVGDACFGLLSF